MATLSIDVETNADAAFKRIDRLIDNTSSKAENFKRKFSNMDFNLTGKVSFPSLSQINRQLLMTSGTITAILAGSYYYFTSVNSRFEQLGIMLNTATGSAEEGKKAMEDLIDLSTKAPFSVDALTDTFIKLKSSGIEDAYDYTVKLSDAISAFGGNSDKLRLVAIATMQMVGKVKLSAEELKRQFGEQVPTAIRILEFELRKTGKLAEDMPLLDAMKKGLIYSNDAVKALMEGLGRYSGAGERRMNSYRGAIQLLNTQFQLLMKDIGDANGSFSSITTAILAGADMIDKFRNSAEGAKVVADIANNIADGFNRITENPELVYEFMMSVANGAEIATNMLSNMIVVLNQIMSTIDLLTGKTNFRAVSLLPEDFNMATYSRIRPELEKASKLIDEMNDSSVSSAASSFAESPAAFMMDNLKKSLTFDTRSALSTEQLEASKAKLAELTETIKNGGKELAGYTSKRKSDTTAAGQQNNAIQDLLNTMGGSSDADYKSHQNMIEYSQTKRDKAKADYEEALLGVRTDEERVKVNEKYAQVLKDIADQESRKSGSGAKAARGELKQLNAELKNYTDMAKAAEEAAKDWISKTDAALSDVSSLVDRFETAGMSDMEKSMFEYGEDMKEAKTALGGYKEALASVDEQIAKTKAAYDLLTSQIGGMATKFGENAAGSAMEDSNRLNAMQREAKGLSDALEELNVRKTAISDLQIGSESLLENINVSYISEAIKNEYSSIGAYTSEIYNFMAEQYLKDRDAFIKATGDKIAANEIYKNRMQELDLASPTTTWQRAAEIGLERVASAANDTGYQIADAIQNGFGDATNALAAFVVKFETDVDGLVEAILMDIARLTIQQTITSPLAGALSSAVGSMFAANAKGGVYSSSSLSSYSNGIYSSPQLFAFAKGAGVFAEAGPEAILPLKRNSKGELGVQSGSSNPPNVSVTVNNAPAGTTAKVEQSKDGMNIDVIVDALERRQQDRVNRGYSGVQRVSPW